MNATVMDYVKSVRELQMGEPLGSRGECDSQYANQLQQVVDRCVGDQGGELHSVEKLYDIRSHFVKSVAALLHPNVRFRHIEHLKELQAQWLERIQYAVRNYLECRGRGWKRIEPWHHTEEHLAWFHEMMAEMEDINGDSQQVKKR